MSTKLLSLLMMTVAFVSQFGCSNSPGTASTDKTTRVSENIQGNWVADRSYENEYFGLKMQIPEDWYFEKGMSSEMAEIGVDVMSANNPNSKAAIEAAMKNTFTPFMAYRYPPGTPGKANPNVICMIESVKHLPGIKTSADYMLLLEQTLKQSQIAVQYENAPEDVSLGGKAFSMRRSSVNLGLASVRQRTYIRKDGGHVLMLSVTTMEEGDDAIVDELINSIESLSGPQ